MPRVSKSRGFQELSPYKIAHELFANLNAGDKIAIAGRFVSMELNDGLKSNSSSVVRDIVSALESRGLVVRLVDNGGPMEDFCFLKHAQKELVGMVMSTYVTVASFLGNANMTRLYVVDSPLMRKAHGTDNIAERFFPPRFTNFRIQTRTRFEVYSMEESDYEL
jgi:hypothetical protein